ncbi:hypothetical protein AB3X52_00625 [Nocardioides sp. DS6]|uniref:NifU family protein n=1 Tax=Nocardioides eburneus TaxID=3231482 RepID=A0ABV3ST46_9ACTN
MSIDQAQLEDFRKTMAADDYHLEVDVTDGAADVRIKAGPDACAECLVPKTMMATMLAPVLGVDAERIALTYPTEFPGDHK